jgi:hypothetical protein
VLALARVRDRLLERLLAEGLGAERDLPGFLRFAGQGEGDRLRTVRERAEQLRQAIQSWFEREAESKGVLDQTPAYIDLLFAFGMARLGETTAARTLLRQATPPLADSRDASHQALLDGYRYRIEQVFAGKPHAGPLPAGQIQHIEELRQRRETTPVDNKAPDSRGVHVVERLREQSHVLDPDEHFDPYQRYGGSDLVKDVVPLQGLTDRPQLETRIRQLLNRPTPGSSQAEARVIILSHTLSLAARVGERLTVELLHQVLPALDGLSSPWGASPPAHRHPPMVERQAELLDRAVFFATHFDRPDLVLQYVDRARRLVESCPAPTVLECAGVLVGQPLRSLRKLGQRDLAERLLQNVADAVYRGRTIAQLKADESRNWLQTLRLLLRIATGRLSFEGLDRAIPILNEARGTILSGKDGSSKEYVRYVELIRSYVAALGQLPIHDAIYRMDELFSSGQMGVLPNTQTTLTHYSRFHLNIAEAVVLALANDDFALGPTARRWLDDDEYLVRRRVHRDVRAALAGAGM